jgi:hypothetical protein
MTTLDRRATLGAIAASYFGAAGLGYWLAPRQLLDSEAKATGLFRTDATHVLSATVESLRDEAQLIVYSYKGTARVQAERSVLWLFGGHQELIVPAVVNYLLPLSDLSLADVMFNEKAKLVTVRLPKVVLGDVAFQPENSTTINGGVLTWSDDQIEALRKMNYANARRAMVAQAQQPGLLDAAKRQARTSIEDYFAIPLRVAGLPDVKVAAAFH